MIRSSMLAVPSRVPVLLAKAVVVAGVVFVVAEIIALTAWATGSAILGDHVSAPLDDATTVRALAGFGLYMAVLAVFALAVGALVRHVGGAITVLVAAVMVLPIITDFLPGNTGDTIAAYLPAQSGDGVMSTGYGVDRVLPVWGGFAVMCGWALGLLALAVVSLRRRDV